MAFTGLGSRRGVGALHYYPNAGVETVSNGRDATPLKKD